MKKIIFAALVFISMDAAAQGVRLNGYANYIFDDRIDSYYDANNYYNGKIQAGFQWGVGLQYMMSPYNGIELAYYREDTKAPMKNFAYPVQNHNYDITLNYIMLNFDRFMRKPDSKVEMFGGGGLGVALINTTDPDPANALLPTESNLTKFAWQFRGGAIIWGSQSFGIKLQAQVQSAVQGAGGGVYFGTGGAGAGVSTYSSVIQFGLGGGIVFKMKSRGK